MTRLLALLALAPLAVLAPRVGETPLLVDASFAPTGGEWCDIPLARPPLLPRPAIGQPAKDKGDA